MKAQNHAQNRRWQILLPVFLIQFGITVAALPDEILIKNGEKFEGVIISQSPSDITVRLKDEVVRIKRSDLKNFKKWPKEKNTALVENWESPAVPRTAKDKRKEEQKHADYARYSKAAWEIYEKDAFIAFHKVIRLYRNGGMRG